jgi:hypothetical protein
MKDVSTFMLILAVQIQKLNIKMKKIFLFMSLAIVAVTGANAQKQEGGEKNLEVQFTPLGTSPIGMNGIRARFFLSESMAVRVGLGLNNQKTTTVREQQITIDGSDEDTKPDVVIPELYDTQKNSGFSFNVGVEKHFAGTDRLSPYAGAFIAIGTSKDNLEKEFHNANNAEDLAKPENWQTFTVARTIKSSTIGGGIVAGFDFYFVDHLYLGAELAFGVTSMKFKDLETEVSNSDAYKYSTGLEGSTYTGTNAQGDSDFTQVHMNFDNTAPEFDTIIGNGKGDYKDRTFGTAVQTTIRLGWLF